VAGKKKVKAEGGEKRYSRHEFSSLRLVNLAGYEWIGSSPIRARLFELATRRVRIRNKGQRSRSISLFRRDYKRERFGHLGVIVFNQGFQEWIRDFPIFLSRSCILYKSLDSGVIRQNVSADIPPVRLSLG